jgi:hypothetical protein
MHHFFANDAALTLRDGDMHRTVDRHLRCFVSADSGNCGIRFAGTQKTIVACYRRRTRPTSRSDLYAALSRDDVIQRRLTIFNDQQGIEDVVLDKKLRICRGC